MTKLEELKAALEAATPGEWEPLMTCGELHVCTPVNEGCDVGTICVPYERPDATFIALSHNLMPTLLEAIDLLETVSSARACQDHEFDVDAWFRQVRSLLGDLK